MLPTGYPFATLIGEGLSLGLPLTPVSLGNALFGTNHCGTSPAQLLHQAVLQSTLGVTFSPLTPVIGSGAIQSTGQVGILPGSVQLTSLNPLTCVNPLAVYSSMGTVPASLGGSGASTAADVDAHTIVRAPVLYKKSPVNSDGDEGQATGANADAPKGNTETSPPDRIVASYAAAAHAAALANHQPVSKAAEVFLAATNTGSGRCRHSKRSRPHGSNSNSSSHLDPAAKRITGSTAVSSSSTASATDLGAPVTSLTGGVSDEWRRIVDRMSGKVIYIAPDGISLNNTAEVCEYFRTRYPSIVDTKNYEALIASTFVFEPVTEAPSLDNALTFIPSVPTTASNDDSPSGTCGTVSTAMTNTSGVSPTPLESNTKPNPPICRIAFNPSVVRSDGSNMFGRKPVSESPTETTTTISNGPAQSTDTESTKESPSEQETSTPSFSIATVPEVVSEATTSTPNSANSDANPELRNECTEESVKASNDSSSPTDAQTQPISENDAQNTQKVNGVLSSDSSPIVDPSFQISASSSAAGLTTCGENNSNATPVSTVEATVARMSTETLTTGILNSTIPSCSSTVIPSVVPPASGDNLNLLVLAGLVSEPSMLYSCGNGEVGTTGLSLNSLLTNSRLTSAQTHTQQQQQLSALISALSTGSTVPQSTYQAPTALIGANSQLNSLVLAGSPQYAVPWSAMGSTPVSWSDLNGSTVMSTLSALQHHQHHQQQQQQLAAAAALQQQQQQIRAAWAAQVAALQRQQMLAGQQQQQQQQLALAAAGQVQAYLAALQRNLSIG